mgnify:CR=1 FL=1|jgi:hypothetical protein
MNYKKLFISKELITLIGPNKRNLLISSALLFVAVFTISFSLGAYEELKERMDNPYTNWVTMPVLYSYRDSIPSLKQHFSNKENLSKYGLKDISGYIKWAFKVVHPVTNKVMDLTGRTMSFSDDITLRTFDKGNILSLKDNFDPNDESNIFEIFVNEEFCRKLNIDVTTAVGKPIQIQDFENDFVLLFNIGAVLKNLPSHSTFIMSQDFMNMFKEKYESTGFVEVEEQTRLTFLSKKEIENRILKDVLPSDQLVDIESIKVAIAGADSVFKYTIFTNDYVSDSLMSDFSKNLKQKGESIILNKEWKFVKGHSEIYDPMYFSFNFIDLEKIRELQSFLKEKYKMEIELSVVEDRDNFSLVSKLTYFMILSLIIVAIISFVIFLVNLIKNHLDKIKPNIGTFMAFGLSSSIIASIYANTIMKFMIKSWSYVFVLLLLFWGIGHVTGLYSLKLLHPLVIFTFILFNLVSYILSKRITNSILNETPGDLIYGRV